MPVPLFANLPLFGQTALCSVAGEERAAQITGYPSINGLEYLDMGDRGGVALVQGTWWFSSEIEQAGTLSTWTQLCDGVPRVLRDSKGLYWNHAILKPYRLEGPGERSAATGYIRQRFNGSLLILNYRGF